MVVVMKASADARTTERIVAEIERMGFTPHLSVVAAVGERL